LGARYVLGTPFTESPPADRNAAPVPAALPVVPVSVPSTTTYAPIMVSRRVAHMTKARNEAHVRREFKERNGRYGQVWP